MPVAAIAASRSNFAVSSGTLTSLNAMRSGLRAAISELISGCRSLHRLWSCSRLSVTTRNCIGLSRQLRITRLCSSTIPLSPRGVYRVWGATLLLLGLYLAPVLVRRPAGRRAVASGAARSDRPLPRSRDDAGGCDPGVCRPGRGVARHLLGPYLDCGETDRGAPLHPLRGRRVRCR